MNFKKLIGPAILSLGLTACIQTRQQLRGDTPSAQGQKQVEMQQEQVKASQHMDSASEEQFRELRNRLDILENQLSQANANAALTIEERQKYNQDWDRRLRAFEEALKNMEIQILGLIKDVHDIKKKDLETSAPVPSKGNFDRGEGLFDKKEWQEAILAYQAYRDQNPKGKNYSEATYKIGVCFQELGMKDEAKAFYSEVISKVPKSNAAKKAKTRLSSLK